MLATYHHILPVLLWSCRCPFLIGFRSYHRLVIEFLAQSKFPLFPLLPILIKRVPPTTTTTLHPLQFYHHGAITIGNHITSIACSSTQYGTLVNRITDHGIRSQNYTAADAVPGVAGWLRIRRPSSDRKEGFVASCMP